MNDTSTFLSQNNSNVGDSNSGENYNSITDTSNEVTGGFSSDVGNDTDSSSDINPSNNQDSNDASSTPTKEKPTKELSATEKQILDAEEKLRKLKEKDKIQKRKQKEKNENDILKVLRSKGLLKVSVSKWEEKISEVAEVFS